MNKLVIFVCFIIWQPFIETARSRRSKANKIRGRKTPTNQSEESM